VIILRLQNGRLIHNAPGYRAPRVLSFAQHNLPIDLPTVDKFRGRGPDEEDELNLFELVRVGKTETLPPLTRNAAIANFHYRIVEIVMMLLMPLLAVALAVPPKRSSSGLGIFLGIVMVVAYHKVNQYAEQMGGLGRIDPVIALWTPFVIFAGLILWMYWTLAYKPGGQPIGALERAFSKLAKCIGRLFRIGRKPVLAPAE
jgi:lipopolysaccharide export system permease protein